MSPTLPLAVALRRAGWRAPAVDRTTAAYVSVLAAALAVALFGGALAPADPDASDLNLAFVGPSAGHPLGFDSQGRDLVSRLLAGARTAVLGPMAVVSLTMVLAATIALIAAWRGGRVDRLLSAALDLLFAFPAILLAIVAAAVFGASLTAAVLALAVAYMPYIARVLRSSLVRERRQEYVSACEV